MPTLTISTDDAVYTNSVTLSDAPAVRITGDRVQFVNSESGRVITTTQDIPAISMEGDDGVVVNEAGGVIRSNAPPTLEDPLVILGTAAADRVENAGTIIGRVALGGGSDTFVSRVTTNTFATVTELGSGDDFFYLRPDPIVSIYDYVDGGDGEDTFVMFEANGNIGGSLVTNVEILDLRVNGFVESFSDLDTILVDYRPAGRNYSGLRFFDTPDADVSILADDGYTTLGVYDRSAIGSLTGSAADDYVDIGNDTLVSGAIALGEGNDTLSVFRSQFEATQQLSIGSELDGGGGTDALYVQLRGGDVFDADNAVNFETVRVSVTGASTATFTIRNVDGVSNLLVSQNNAAPVLVEESDLSAGNLTVEPKASVVIAASTIVGQVLSWVPFPIDTPVADDTKSISIVNHGKILGDVRMYIGDDVFDSRVGTVDGQVFGYAGNDSIQTDAGDDWLDGGAGADFLSAGAGSDTLLGGSAGDTLIGGSGADHLDGGPDNDTYFVDNAGDDVVEATNGGYDNVLAIASYVLGAGAAVEVLSTTNHGGTAAIDLTGNALGQAIIGNAAANTLIGGGGPDTLQGLGGNDTMYVDSDDGVLEAIGGGYDNVLASSSYILGAGVEVEILSTTNHGGTAAINLTGNELGQAVIGNAAANTLIGGGGPDTLQGLGGNDTMYADSDDGVLEAVGGGYDNVLASNSFILGAGAEVEVFSTTNHGGTAAINLTGNEFGQVIIGNAAANTLIGGGGVDALQGLDGNDFLFVDANDTVIEVAGGGYDNVLTSASYVLGAAAAVEVLSTTNHGGTAAIDLTGNAFGQAVIGNAGVNTINGGAGADALVGLGGTDTFVFTSALGGDNVDAISDFSAVADTIALDDAVFTALTPGPLPAGAFVAGTAAADANDRIVYDSATGNIFYDADGNGGGAAVLFATVQAGTALTASDFMVI